MNASSSYNHPEFTVSELSKALKVTVEDAFGYVRVKGEVSGCKLAPSGHLYLSLKDEGALLAAICWKGVVQKLPFKPSDGLEVVCTGHITTYAGQSKYQLIIESMQPAGEGALMALLAARKKQLEAEGLFDSARKKPLPFFPHVIGVVTSPTGAVIQDILHRLADRFPCRVLVWPVLVQGEQAAKQIADAITGFNAIPASGSVPRPDVLIVARGGGSLEDLWAFNEEIVVRSAARSAIPLISAVGHETDTTLIDYAADRRAPTPTAAAEIATPVQSELKLALETAGRRMMHGAMRLLGEKGNHVTGLSRGLPNPTLLLEQAMQRLDDITMRLPLTVLRGVTFKQKHLSEITAALLHPGSMIEAAQGRLRFSHAALFYALRPFIYEKSHRLALLQSRFGILSLSKEIRMFSDTLTTQHERSYQVMGNRIHAENIRVKAFSGLLESYHYQKILQRGFALLRDSNNKPVTSVHAIKQGEIFRVELKDGACQMIAAPASSPKLMRTKKQQPEQGALF